MTKSVKTFNFVPTTCGRYVSTQGVNSYTEKLILTKLKIHWNIFYPNDRTNNFITESAFRNISHYSLVILWKTANNPVVRYIYISVVITYYYSDLEDHKSVQIVLTQFWNELIHWASISFITS